jgi:hypothetical protein
VWYEVWWGEGWMEWMDWMGSSGSTEVVRFLCLGSIRHLAMAQHVMQGSDILLGEDCSFLVSGASFVYINM